MKRAAMIVWAAVTFCMVGYLVAIAVPHPAIQVGSVAPTTSYADKSGDQELAYLLVKLVLRTRATLSEHYTRAQSPVPGVDLIYKRWLAKNTILPAAVADHVFADVVPGATGGRAWVKMVVEEPRNPHNAGDEIAMKILHILQDSAPTAEMTASGAYYYGEPIKATETCLPCHGEPRGAPDPLFPKYQKNGWKAGEIVGAVVARVASES